MSSLAVQTNLPDVNAHKWKWTALGTTVAGSTVGDWVYVGDLAERSGMFNGSFASTLTWQGSINGNTSDAVPFTLHTSTGATFQSTASGGNVIAESVEYIRPVAGSASSATSVDAYLWGRINPR